MKRIPIQDEILANLIIAFAVTDGSSIDDFLAELIICRDVSSQDVPVFVSEYCRCLLKRIREEEK